MATTQGDGFPDLLHKMSKKIAQLTKVIYHLNTRNEDNETSISRLRKHHVSEIDNILRDASNKIEEFKLQMEQRREAQIAHELKQQLENQHAKEKKEAMRAFSDFKQLVAEREKKLQDDHIVQIRSLQHQVSSLSQTTEQKVAVFQEKVKCLESLAESGGSAIVELRAKHQEEIAQLVRDSNEKYNSMLTTRMEEEDKLKSELSQIKLESKTEIDRITQKFEYRIKTLEEDAAKEQASILHSQQILADEELSQVKVALNAQLLESQTSVSTLEQKLAYSLKEIDTYKQQLDEIGNLEAGHVAELRAAHAKCKELSHENERLSQSLSNQSKQHSVQIEALEMKLAELGSFRTSSEKQVREAKMTTNTLQAKIETMKLEQVKLEQSYKNELKSSEEKSNTIQHKLNEQSKIVSQLKLQLSTEKVESEKVIERLKLESERFEQEVSRKVNELKTCKLSLNELEKKLERQLHVSQKKEFELMERLKSLKDNTAELENQLRGKEQSLIADKSETVSQTKLQLEQQQVKHEQAQLELRTSFEANEELLGREILNLENKLKEECKLTTKRRNQLEETKRELESVKGMLNEKTVALETKLANKNGETYELQASLENAETKVKEYQRQVNIVKQQLAKALERENNLKDAIKDVTEQAESKLKVVTTRLTQEIEDSRNQLQESIQQKHKDHISVLISEYDTKLSNAKIDHENIVSSFKHKVTTQEAKIEGLLQQLQSLEQTHSSQVTETIETWKAKLSAERDLHQQNLNDLNTKHREVLKNVKATWEAKVDNVQAHSTKTQEAKLSESLKQSNMLHKEQMEQLKTQYEGEIENIKEEMKLKVSNWKQIETEYDDASTRRKLEIEALRNQTRTMESMVQELENKLSSAHLNASATQKLLDDSKKKVKQLEELRESDAKDFKSQQSKIIDEFAKEKKHSLALLERDIQSIHRQELETIEHEFESRENELTMKHQKLQSLNESRIQDLEAYAEELRYRLDRRESRDEDINTIQQLKQLLSETQDSCQQKEEQLKHFKRELLNREESYNKVFNRTPNIGVMQVVKPKQSGKERKRRKSESRNQELHSSSDPLPPLPITGNQRQQTYWSQQLQEQDEMSGNQEGSSRIEGDGSGLNLSARVRPQQVQVKSKRGHTKLVHKKEMDTAPILGRRRNSTGSSSNHEVPHPPLRKPNFAMDIKIE